MDPEAAPSATILVVDDHEQNRELFKATLEDEGMRVVLARSGLEGIAAFQREHPDCVVLDVRMPDLDGFEVCRRLRALPGGDETPIVFVTALRDLDTFEAALRSGGDDFLTKPVRPTELALRVQAALRLRRISEERRDLVGLLRAQRDDLMRAVLHKERLTAFLVHDLKNPVTGMKLASDLIRQDRGASSRTQAAAARIGANAESLLRMITDLMDISRMDEGKLVLARAEVALGALVAEVVEALSMRAAAARVDLVHEVEVGTVRADSGLFRRVLENLVENAIRHAPPESVVRVAAHPGDAAVELRVVDHGPGVPPGLRERIFDRFVQGEAGAHADRAGRGLGLAFCKLVIEAHGGRIWVEDASPGAAFRIRLPLGD